MTDDADKLLMFLNGFGEGQESMIADFAKALEPLALPFTWSGPEDFAAKLAPLLGQREPACAEVERECLARGDSHG